MRFPLILAAAAICCGACAQLIVGNDQTGTTSIYAIDVSNGSATALLTGSTNDVKPWGMAADNVNNILYWNNGGNLYKATYADILGGTATLTPTAMTFNGSSVNFVSLAYNPNTGMLLGTRNIATEAVYEIDPNTGVATQVYVYPSTFDYGGLDYDDSTNQLYGLNDATGAPGGRGLFRIDVGAQTSTFLTAYPGGETDIDGLGVGNGKAYFVTDGPNTTQASFYVYDIASGLFENPLGSPFTGSGTFSAGAWAPGLMVPEPASVIAIGVGLTALLALRRRK